jgi:hypothetical protein
MNTWTPFKIALALAYLAAVVVMVLDFTAWRP